MDSRQTRMLMIGLLLGTAGLISGGRVDAQGRTAGPVKVGAGSDTTAPHRDTLPEVTIKGYPDAGSVRQAIRLQQAASLIVDIVAEEAIEHTPDLTVADVTRRVTGLSVTTDNSGQSDRTIIRGMDPKYNYTLVNGIKIPSPGDRSRYVPLGIFPADIVQRVEVYKKP